MKQGDPKNMQERGSGRTYRQLEKLRSGDFFLVASVAEAQRATEMLHKHFIGKAVLVKVVSQGMEPDFLRGLGDGRWVEVDHHLWEIWTSTQDDRTRRQAINFREAILPINSRSGRADE